MGCASSAWFLTGPPRKRAAIRVPAPMPTSPMNSACCATTPKPCAISGRSAACPCWPKSLIIPIFFPIQKVRGPVWRRASPRSRKPCGFSSLSVGNRALPGVPPLPVPSRAARTAAPLPGRGWLRDRLLPPLWEKPGTGQLPPRPSLLLFPCPARKAVAPPPSHAKALEGRSLRVKEGSPYPEVFPPVLPSPPSRILPAPSSILTGNTCGIPIPRR